MDGVSSGLSSIPASDPRLPENAVAVDHWLPSRATFADGLRHRKTAPCTIIAIAVHGRYEVGRADGSRATARPGEAFLAQEGEALDIVHRSPGPGRVMEACWAHFRVTVFGSQDACQLIELPPVLAAGASARIRALFDATELPQPGLGGALDRAQAALAALRILAEVGRPSPAGRRLLTRAVLFAPLAAWVRARLGDPIALDDLAVAAGLSRSRLNAHFQRDLGLSPLAWVRELRLQAARNRLVATAEPVAAISAACGFPDPFHFSRTVRARFGQSPLGIRRSLVGAVAGGR